MKTSIYALRPQSEKIYGQMLNVTTMGAGVSVAERPPFSEKDFLEITIKDSRGGTHTYLGQIRWMQVRKSGEWELGLQFVAAAS